MHTGAHAHTYMGKWPGFPKSVFLGSNSECVLVGALPCLSLAWVDSVPPRLPFCSSELQLELEGISGPRSRLLPPWLDSKAQLSETSSRHLTFPDEPELDLFLVWD